MTAATSSKLVTAGLGVVRIVRAVGTLTLAACIEGTPGEDSIVVGIVGLGGAVALPKTVEPKVLPATASVDVIGVKWPKLPVAELSAPVNEKKWIVPVSLEAHRIVELSLNARQ